MHALCPCYLPRVDRRLISVLHTFLRLQVAYLLLGPNILTRTLLKDPEYVLLPYYTTRKIKDLYNLICTLWIRRWTVAACCKVCPDFYCSNTWIVGSNPTSVVNVCRRLFCICIVLCSYTWASYKLSKRLIIAELLLNYNRIERGFATFSYPQFILIGQSMPQNFTSRKGDTK